MGEALAIQGLALRLNEGLGKALATQGLILTKVEFYEIFIKYKIGELLINAAVYVSGEPCVANTFMNMFECMYVSHA